MDGESAPGYLTDISKCVPYATYQDGTLTFSFGVMPEDGMSLNEVNGGPEWINNLDDITTVVFDPMFKYARLSTCLGAFAKCKNLTEIRGIEYLNTEKVVDMRGMFAYCESLTMLDLTHFNTVQVKDMGLMFYQ